MKRSATARWEGNLKEGKGTFAVASGAIKGTPYSFKTRFEGTPGANPEELVAAAHASPSLPTKLRHHGPPESVRGGRWISHGSS
jgi:hypothetical protein